MSDRSPLPDTRSPERTALAATRHRLGAHAREAAALAAPSRLLAAGVDAVKTGASAQVAGAVQRVSALTSAEVQRPGLVTIAAGAAVSLLLGLLARSRHRRGLPGRGRAAGVVRSSSPWLGLALAIATAYLGRPADHVQ